MKVNKYFSILIIFNNLPICLQHPDYLPHQFQYHPKGLCFYYKFVCKKEGKCKERKINKISLKFCFIVLYLEEIMLKI